MTAVRRIGDAALTALAPAVWGSTYLVTTELLPPDRPLLAATVRALPAGLFLVLLGRRLPTTAQWWWRAGVLGLLNIGLFFFLLFVAAYELPGGVAALVGSVQPLVVLVASALLLSAAVTRGDLLACALGLVGIAMLVLRDGAGITVLGVAAGLGAAVSMGLGIVLVKRWGRPAGVGVLAFTGWQLAAGGLLLLPATLLVEGLPPGLTGPNVAGFAYLSIVGAVIAYAVWFRGIERLPALAASFLGFFSPLVATVLGWAVLDQRLSAVQVAGAVLVVASVALAQWSSYVRAAPSAVRRPAPAPLPVRRVGKTLTTSRRSFR